MGSLLRGGSQKEYEEQDAGEKQAHGETQQDAEQLQMQGKCKQPCGGNAYNYIAYESNPQHRHHARRAAQSIGESYLCGVAELIQHQGKKQGDGGRKYGRVFREYAEDAAAAEYEDQRRARHEREHYVVALPGRAPHLPSVARTGHIGDYHRYGSADTVI